ncbi:hypothetical protein [Candidatus Protofrankia datiscae]|uniref:hypothetical protein n=1 Tax=Candidatus Protofrankia datiscae TaxID=2716812 RepID=UPI0002D3759B|nr:hypothetical protein [Candidatus Protofrankia datiscae]
MATRRRARTTRGTQLPLPFDADGRSRAGVVSIPLVRAADASPPITMELRRRSRARR